LREYELTFIVQPEISDEGCAAVREKLDAVLQRSGALRLLYDDWGKRKLSYEIAKFQKGHYFVLSFLDAGKAVPELERILRTDYRIDRYQDCYFVIDSFAQLMRETAPDFTPIYARLRHLPALDPSAP